MSCRGFKNRIVENFLTAVIVIAALTTVAIPRLATSTPKYKADLCKTELSILNDKIHQFYIDHDRWPDSVDELKKFGYFSDKMPQCPFGQTYEIGLDHQACRHQH